MDYHLRSHIELDTTEATQQQQHLFKNGYYPKTKQKDKKKKKKERERRENASKNLLLVKRKQNLGALLVTV